MDWLGGWLKQIIFIILLATFIDLILPNKSMQRYVKLVVSLLILITIMKPLVSLFQQDFAGKLASSYEQIAQMNGSAQPTSASLAQIVREGDRLSQKQAAQVVETVQRQLAAEMKQQLEDQLGVSIKEVQVTVANLANPSRLDSEQITEERVAAMAPEIEKVVVYLQGMNETPTPSEQMTDMQPIAAMKPIDPVRIQLESVAESEESEIPEMPEMPATAASIEPAAGNPQDVALSNDVIAYLKSSWGVPPNKVDIYNSVAEKLH